MKLSIQLEMPPPQREPEKKQPRIEDRVREAVELCESGYCSHTEWLMLQRLCRALKEKKQTPRVQNLLGMIQPLLNKYGYHDTPTEEQE